MVPDHVAVFATTIILLPMLYLLLAAPAFLLVRLDVRQVGQLLRVMFNGYFLALIATSAVGTLAVAAEGRFAVALGIGAIVALTVAWRRWFLRHMDAWLLTSDAGDPGAAHQLRRLHWGGMLGNAVQIAVVLAAIPHIAVVPA
jgi:hypothetical protein